MMQGWGFANIISSAPLPCLHPFWHAILASFYIFNVFSLLQKLELCNRCTAKEPCQMADFDTITICSKLCLWESPSLSVYLSSLQAICMSLNLHALIAIHTPIALHKLNRILFQKTVNELIIILYSLVQGFSPPFLHICSKSWWGTW